MGKPKEFVQQYLRFPKAIETGWDLGQVFALTLTGIGFVTPGVEACLNLAGEIRYKSELRHRKPPTLEEMKEKLPGGTPLVEAARTRRQLARLKLHQEEGFSNT